jgi:hypothetical protein
MEHNFFPPLLLLKGGRSFFNSHAINYSHHFPLAILSLSLDDEKKSEM